MTGMDWDRVHFEDLIAKQGSEWIRQEFYHHGYFEPGPGRSPKVFCKHCKEKFPLNGLEKHVRLMHQFVVIKHASGEKGAKVLRRPLKKQLKETRVGRELIALLKSPISKKQKKMKRMFLKPPKKQPTPIVAKSTSHAEPHNPRRLMGIVRKLVPKRNNK